MSDKRQQAIDKIKKLLRLAKSSNEHEAALAAARAQELLSRYNLSESDYGEQELPKEAGLAHAAIVKKPANWVWILASKVAGAHDCQYFFAKSGHMCFIGVDIDHEIASFTFGYLYRCINRLATAFMGKSQQKRLTLKGQKKVRISYCLGCAQVVAWELAKQKERTPITTTALVPVKHALIVAKVDTYGLRTEDHVEENLSDRAYWIGRRDGTTIDHGRRGVPAKKSKQLRIGR